VGHKGKLFAGNSYWMDPRNIWYGGDNPKTAWAQILRLDEPDGKWQVDLEMGPNNLRAENLKSVTFTTDSEGNEFEEPVKLLIATAFSSNEKGADINVFVRDDKTGRWDQTALLTGTGEAGENNSTRSMTVYRDKVTGVDRLFLPVGVIGIFTGVFDPGAKGKIRWNEKPEVDGLSKRCLSIIESNGALIYSSGTTIYRRNDGPSPTHSVVFDASRLSTGKVASPVGGVRGLSAIPNPNGSGDSLLFVWAPDSRSRSCVIRLDSDRKGDYVHTQEACIADAMSEYLGGNPVYYALAGYNNILPVVNPLTNEPAWLMGFECWIGGRQFPCWQGNEQGGFYAGAMYAVRDKNSRFWLNEVNGPADGHKAPLQAVRAYTVSPFDSEHESVIYFGGFVGDHGPSHNTAWVFKTSIENALRKDAPRPKELTPEQSKAQLEALRQPREFEYRGKPSFNVQIPGEFAKRKPTDGSVFKAFKAFNHLVINVRKLEEHAELGDAAKQYVGALKMVGSGNAELVSSNETQLLDGTAAVELTAKWINDKNSASNTQGLIVHKDGYAITIATHTWEVKPPDKRFFYTLKFE
jgi:hypothetical protein